MKGATLESVAPFFILSVSRPEIVCCRGCVFSTNHTLLYDLLYCKTLQRSFYKNLSIFKHTNF